MNIKKWRDIPRKVYVEDDVEITEYEDGSMAAKSKSTKSSDTKSKDSDVAKKNQSSDDDKSQAWEGLERPEEEEVESPRQVAQRVPASNDQLQRDGETPPKTPMAGHTVTVDGEQHTVQRVGSNGAVILTDGRRLARGEYDLK